MRSGFADIWILGLLAAVEVAVAYLLLLADHHRQIACRASCLPALRQIVEPLSSSDRVVGGKVSGSERVWEGEGPPEPVARPAWLGGTLALPPSARIRHR